jgi:hypothetical protein
LIEHTSVKLSDGRFVERVRFRAKRPARSSKDVLLFPQVEFVPGVQVLLE